MFLGPSARWFEKLSIILCLVVTASWSSEWSGAAERGRPPASRRVERLLSPWRTQTAKPEEVLGVLRVEPGQVVADIGSGPGYFTIPFARAVGPSGRVYGVDIEPLFLAELERQAKLAELPNVVAVLTTPDSPGLPVDSVDLAFFCSVYRHIADRRAYLQKLRGCLRPGGRIAVFEWRKTGAGRLETPSSRKVGPREAEKIDPDQVVRELQESGFTILRRPGFLDYYFYVIAGLRN